MATSYPQIKALLDEAEIRYRELSDGRIGIVYTMDNYVDNEARKALLVMIEVLEDGEYVSIFAPQAYTLTGAHVAVTLQACAMFQWSTKLIQFEFDVRDGELRPKVELPLEDATLTSRQLSRCIRGIAKLVDDFHPTLDLALKSGEIKMPERAGPAVSSDGMLRVALAAMLAEGVAEDDPRVRALRALIEPSPSNAPRAL